MPMRRRKPNLSLVTSGDVATEVVEIETTVDSKTAESQTVEVVMVTVTVTDREKMVKVTKTTTEGRGEEDKH